MRPALLLEADATLRSAVQLRHRHVLVDEYQDVNHASARLLRAVAGNGHRLWVVGDSRQSIYRFRGASSANMTAFMDEYPDAGVDQLSINYRSTEQVIKAFASFAPHMGASSGMLPLDLSSNRGRGPGAPEIRRYDTLDQEAEGVAASIRELEASGVRLCDQAVLCRTNGRLNQIAAALEVRGIPVLHLGSLFERDEVRDLLALLSLAVDSYGSGLTRVGTMPRYNLCLQDVYLVTQHIRERDGPALSGLADLARVPGLSIEGAAGLARLANDLTGLSTASSAWEFLATYLLDRSELAREMARCTTVTDRLRAVAVWQFLNFVRELSPARSGLPIQRMLDRVRQLVLLSEERDLRQVPPGALHMDAVRLMTVHGSKGLEFEAVHIPGLTVASFPSTNRGQRCPPPVGMIVGAENLTVSEESKRTHDHEEQCLFFVAMSRARTHLRFYLARLQQNGKNRSPSPFVGCIPRHLLKEIANPPMLHLPQNALRPKRIQVIRPADWHVTDSRLGSYNGCPLRFFYTHMLGLGGARKATAFSRTHDCLYEFIRWLSDARLAGNPAIDAAEEELERIWQARGPSDHAFAVDYRRLASRLMEVLVQAGRGYRFSEAEPLAVDFSNGRVLVEPNEMAKLPDGTTVLRRVRTGYKRTNEYDQLDYTLYHLAGQSRFKNRFVVEALHLTDGTRENVTVTAQKISNRSTKTNDMLANIAAGSFPAEIDAVTCPRCPHFFICTSLPDGSLNIT
jgi:superfamily I DNA/RNA helicase